MMAGSGRDGDISVVHTLVFENSEMNEAFNELAGSAEGLPVAREAHGNLFACPYVSKKNNYTTYMFSRWETEKDWYHYLEHRRDISPDWFLPMCEPETYMLLRELDTIPTKTNKEGDLLFAPGPGAIANVHVWQFDSAEFKDEVAAFWGNEEVGLPASRAYPGNIFVSGFEPIGRENCLVALNAWESYEVFLEYRQMRRDTSPDIVQPFLVDDVMVQADIIEDHQDPRVVT
jgi:hypothetical protein